MMPKKSAAKNNTNPFSEFVLFTNGGESVSFACTSSPAHNLFFKFVLFPTITFVRLIRFAHGANLRTLLSCAHLYGWALPVPPCERIFSTIYFGIVARHDTVVLRSFPRISPKISLSRAHKFKQYHLFFLTLFLQNLYGKN